MKIMITGLSGSGKTAILKASKLKNIYFADNYVKDILYKPLSPVFNALAQTYPEIIINNMIDNKKLGIILFNNRRKLQAINELIKPFVRSWIMDLPNNSIVEMAGYMDNETKYKDLFDKVILIKRTNPIIKGKFDYIKQKNFQPIINRNINANYVIFNNGTLNQAVLEFKQIINTEIN